MNELHFRGNFFATALRHCFKGEREVCERHYFRGHIPAVYKILGLKVAIIKKVVIVVNCITGYKLEYYRKKDKILTSKLKFIR